MQINLLGPVEVSSANGRVALGGPKPRALLAMLALDAGSTVSAERLIDGLWGDEPPATSPGKKGCSISDEPAGLGLVLLVLLGLRRPLSRSTASRSS